MWGGGIMTFTEHLNSAWQSQNSLLCVGLDPDPAKFPAGLAPKNTFDFCKGIIDATATYACCFKPQIAYFSSNRQEGALEDLIAYTHETYPRIPVILDAKRGDIGATAEQYAREAFERYKADALTVSPYMGLDSMEPYMAYPDKGIIILCRTSNRGGSDLQSLKVQPAGQSPLPLYEHIANLASNAWNRNGQIGLVVGATFPEELQRVRHIVGNMPLLVPGIGAQGGDVEATVANGCDVNLNGMMISSSRAILYAANDSNWKAAASLVAQQTRDAINSARFKA
jgi:orotidine-5'-phosphate decarboxylase